MVSTVASSRRPPSAWRTSGSIQSTKYWAAAVSRALTTFSGLARARARWAAVMAPVSTMASSTSRARAAERSGFSAGL